MTHYSLQFLSRLLGFTDKFLGNIYGIINSTALDTLQT